MRIDYAKRSLANGLDVIVHPDRSCPIVAVNLWYHVGSKNERPGRTGFAHLFEHLMFEGSAHHDHGFFRPLQEAGGSLNGSTSPDRTNYWEVVPTGALERAMWMESDRMGYLLPALTQSKFDTQRQVVLNERRQNYENRPYGMVSSVLMAALFGEGHPYRWITIGEPADLEAAGLDDVRDFFRTYYHPGNASLALAGDLDVETGFALADRYFGSLDRGPDPPAVVVSETRNDLDTRLLLEDRVELARLYLAWRTPGLFAPGDAALDLLGQVLSGGKSSRLYRTLVRDRQIATDVGAGQSSRELDGVFTIVATARPGHGLAELDDSIRSEMDRLAADGPTADEIERSLATIEADFAYRLQTVGGFGGRSDQLNAYNVYRNDPGFFDGDLGRYLALGPADVRDAARRFLPGGSRVALSVVPRRGALSDALADSTIVRPT